MTNGMFLVAYGDLLTHGYCVTVTVVIVWLICFLCSVVGFQSTLIVKNAIQYWNSWTWLEAGRTVMDCTCSLHMQYVNAWWRYQMETFSALLAHRAHYVVIVMMYARIVFKYNGPFYWELKHFL